VSESESGLQHETGDHVGDPHGEAAHASHPSPREYVRIGLILIVLTALEVTASYSKVRSAILIPTLLGLAFVKFVLVVLWFMHLKFDDRRYARFFVMGLALAFTLYLVVLISFKVFLR
jgi:cytochrome c oxidase subunit 4